MKWFKNKITDERIVHTQNKIYREISILVSVISLLSIITKFIFYGPTEANVITEYIILFAQGIYYLVRASSSGIYSDEVELKDRTSRLPISSKNILLGLGLGIVFSVIFGIRNAILYGDGMLNSLWFFALVFVATFMIYAPIFILLMVVTHSLATKRSKKANEETYEED